MAAFGDDLYVFAVDVDGLLGGGDGGGGFYGDFEGDGLAGGDAAGDASSVVGEEVTVFHVVVGLGPGEGDEFESVAYFDAFECADGHEGVGEACVEFSEYGVAESDRDAFDVELDDAADGVFLFADVEDGLFHFFGGLGVCASDGVLFDLCVVAGVGVDVGDLDGVCVEGDALFFEDVCGDGSGGDAGGGFSCGGASAASVVSESIFFVEGEVGVSGSEEVFDVVVVFGALVLVLDEEGDGVAGGFAFEYAGEDLNGVFFFALGGDFGLAGFASLHLFVDGLFVDFDSGFESVHDGADGFSV